MDGGAKSKKFIKLLPTAADPRAMDQLREFFDGLLVLMVEETFGGGVNDCVGIIVGVFVLAAITPFARGGDPVLVRRELHQPYQQPRGVAFFWRNQSQNCVVKSRCAKLGHDTHSALTAAARQICESRLSAANSSHSPQ